MKSAARTPIPTSTEIPKEGGAAEVLGVALITGATGEGVAV